MRSLLPGLMALSVAAAPRPAAATWPEDIVISGLGTWNGAAVEEAITEEAFRTVVNEMGLAIANKPQAPGETLGLNGFDVGLSSTVAFIHTEDSSSAQPSAWSRVHQDGTPGSVAWIPWIHARKGLPLSLEVGASMGYVAFSRQTVFAGFGRWGLIEGYRPIPDVALQVGYSGYVGNHELELGAMDVSVNAGYTLPFGTLAGINQAQFSPWVGVGSVRIHAAPRISAEEQVDLGIGRVSGFKGSDWYADGYSHTVFQAGFRIVSGDAQIRLAASIAPETLTTVHAGLGFSY